MRLHQYLHRACLHIRVHRTVEGVLYNILVVLILGALLYAAGYWTDGGGVMQSVFGLGFVLVVLWGVTFRLIVPVFHRVGEQEIIRQVEDGHPELQQRMSTTRYLQQHPDEVEQFRFSPSLVEETLKEHDQELNAELFKEFRSWRSMKGPAVLAGLLLVGWGGLWGFNFQGIQRVASDYRAALGSKQIVGSPFTLESPGDLIVPRGSTAGVTVTASHPVKKALVHYRASDEAWKSVPMQPVDTDGKSFLYEIPSVRSPLAYYISAHEQISRPVLQEHPAVQYRKVGEGIATNTLCLSGWLLIPMTHESASTAQSWTHTFLLYENHPL